MKNLTMSVTLMIITLSSCAGIKKMKDKSSLNEDQKLMELIKTEKTKSTRYSSLLMNWFQDRRSINALIHSDSAIRFMPNNGFHIDGGTIWVQQDAGRSELTTQSSAESKSERDETVMSHISETAKNEDKIVVDKERDDYNLGVWYAIIIVVISIAVASKIVRGSK